MIFKIGQKVTSKHKEGWVRNYKTGKEDCYIYPSFGEVVTIEDINESGCLMFKEYTQMYKGHRVYYVPTPFVLVITSYAKETAEVANTFQNPN